MDFGLIFCALASGKRYGTVAGLQPWPRHDWYTNAASSVVCWGSLKSQFSEGTCDEDDHAGYDVDFCRDTAS